MKMRYLKTFENFSDPNDMGRFSGDSDEQEWLEHIRKKGGDDESPEEADEFEEERELCTNCGAEGCPECDGSKDEFDEEEGEEHTHRRKVWGDEVIEKKKFNFEKGKKKDDKKEDKKDDKKAEKKEPKKGLTAGQKKLPEAMQKAILKKQK